MGDDALRADRHALAEHGAAGDLAVRADPRAGPDDRVAHDAALADLGALEHHRALHGGPGPDARARADHAERPAVRPVGHLALALDHRGRDDAPVDGRARLDRAE